MSTQRAAESKREFFRNVWRLSAPYWTSEEKRSAWLLLVTIVSMNLAIVYVNVLITNWNNDFYNALQAVNKAAFFKALWRFCRLATAYIILAVYQQYLQQMLQIRWRRWLTRHYLDRWLSQQTFYRMQLLDSRTDNPDQRISNDIDSFTYSTLNISLGLLSSIVTLFSFVTMLWTLSGPLAFTLGSFGHLRIPGYMVWVAIGYAIVGSWLTIKVGRPLVRLNFNQQRFEADFRFSMVRLREHSESIALYAGEANEGAGFLQRFGALFDNYWEIMKQQKRLTWLTSGYGQVAIVFPILVAAPRFFSGAIKLGGLMQISSAFGQVQSALSFLVNSFTDLASWKAVVDRLTGFQADIVRVETLRAQDSIRKQSVAGDQLRVAGLSLRLPAGRPLLDNLGFELAPGDWLLISGPSGAGKSTLLRALAGIWPFGEGDIALPSGKSALFLPQKPYLPLGTLRRALAYPGQPGEGGADDARYCQALEACGLQHLAGRLDETDQWSHCLSLGEQQRVAIARALLQAPALLFLDEATASLDEAAEAALHQLLKTALPETIVVSVGHRSSLAAWHDQRLHVSGDGRWQLGPMSTGVAQPAA